MKCKINQRSVNKSTIFHSWCLLTQNKWGTMRKRVYNGSFIGYNFMKNNISCLAYTEKKQQQFLYCIETKIHTFFLKLYGLFIWNLYININQLFNKISNFTIWPTCKKAAIRTGQTEGRHRNPSVITNPVTLMMKKKQWPLNCWLQNLFL